MGDFVSDAFGFVTDTLFGTEAETDISPTEKLSPEQTRILKLLEGIIGGRAGEGEAELQPAEALSLAALEQQSMNLVGGDTAGEFGEGAIRDVFSRDPQDFQDFFETTVRDPALRDFERDILPAISGKFATRFFGGERQEAQSRATEDLLRLLTEARSGLAFQTEQSQREQELGALGLLPGIAGIDLSQILATLGGGRETRESLATDESRRISQALAFIGLPTEEIIATTTPGRQGTVQAALGSAGSTAGTLGAAKAFGVKGIF